MTYDHDLIFYLCSGIGEFFRVTAGLFHARPGIHQCKIGGRLFYDGMHRKFQNRNSEFFFFPTSGNYGEFLFKALLTVSFTEGFC